MKKLKHSLLLLFATALLASCGSKEEAPAVVEVERPESLKSFMEYDLSKHGVNMVVLVPDTNQNKLEIIVQSWGETEIRAGKNFQIKIGEGGDLALRKSDLAEDLLYKATYIVDEPTGVVYKQEVENGGMDPAYHFYSVIEIDGAKYEVQDLGEESISEAVAKQLYDAAKFIKSNKKPAQS